MQLNTDVMKNSFTQRGAVAKTNPGQKMPPFWRRQKARPFTFEKEWESMTYELLDKKATNQCQVLQSRSWSSEGGRVLQIQTR